MGNQCLLKGQAAQDDTNDIRQMKRNKTALHLNQNYTGSLTSGDTGYQSSLLLINRDSFLS